MLFDAQSAAQNAGSLALPTATLFITCSIALPVNSLPASLTRSKPGATGLRSQRPSDSIAPDAEPPRKVISSGQRDGATVWFSPSYDAQTGLVYVATAARSGPLFQTRHSTKQGLFSPAAAKTNCLRTMPGGRSKRCRRSPESCDGSQITFTSLGGRALDRGRFSFYAPTKGTSTHSTRARAAFVDFQTGGPIGRESDGLPVESHAGLARSRGQRWLTIRAHRFAPIGPPVWKSHKGRPVRASECRRSSLRWSRKKLNRRVESTPAQEVNVI